MNRILLWNTSSDIYNRKVSIKLYFESTEWVKIAIFVINVCLEIFFLSPTSYTPTSIETIKHNWTDCFSQVSKCHWLVNWPIKRDAQLYFSTTRLNSEFSRMRVSLRVLTDQAQNNCLYAVHSKKWQLYEALQPLPSSILSLLLVLPSMASLYSTFLTLPQLFFNEVTFHLRERLFNKVYFPILNSQAEKINH